MTRPRLLAQLDRGLERGLILISAPAGYGKTSLVVDWLAQRPDLTAAWVSLDENDNDSDVFLRYLTTAVHNAFSPERPCAATQSLLGAAQPPPVETVASTLINDLDHLPRPMVLVLDDYHLITHPAIRQVMAALVRHLPDALRLVLVTRMDVALPQLARRRAQQQLLEIRAADLRLAKEETRAILVQTTGADVDAATVAVLEEQTEGWVIGLQLAGLSLREQEDSEAFVRAFQTRHHRLIMDFLLDEVLAQQPAPVLDFLLRTAVLDRLCHSLCEALVGQGRVGEGRVGEASFLTLLARSGLFLVSLDEDETWYRYHHLFQTLLRRRLEHELGADEVAALHRRAGAWLADNNYTDEALRHLLAAGDAAAAAALVEERRHDMLNLGEMHGLARWLRLLPEDVVARRPALLQLKAWMLRWQAKLHAVPPLLRQAEALLEQETEAAGGENVNPDILRGERDCLRAEMALFQNEFHACLTFTQSALDRLPSHYYYARALAVFFQLLARQNLGQTSSALRQINAWLSDDQYQHYAYRFLLLLASGTIYGLTGDLQRLEQVSRSLLKLGLDEERPLSITWASHFLGHVYYEWNRLAEAEAHWSTVTEWRYQANFRAYHEAVMGLALINQARGDEAQAHDTLDSLTQVLLETNQLQFAPEVESFRARLALLRGDASAAVHWAQTGETPARIGLWFWETNDLTRVKALIVQETAESQQKAAALLAACRQYAEETHNVWLLIQYWALAALLARAQGQPEEALAAAGQAVRLAEPGGYVRLFVELGADMADLLAQLAARGVAPDYVGRVLAVFPTAPSPEPEPLTRRELEILSLLRDGLSDREIAERLVLSLLTVKKHNSHIYQKLGVTGRRAAIARAKTLNLIA